MPYKFDVNKFFPRRILDAITETRVSRPEAVVASAARRKRRAQPARDGKLNMLACDHPARGVIGSLNDPVAMGNRQDYMGRAVRSLLCEDFDGVMAQMDMIEDLLILDHLLQESGGPSLLDDRVVAGCMNRGGIVNVAGEIHDRFTSFTADSIATLGLDGGKMLIRTVDDDERTLVTLGECSKVINALNRHNLMVFVEPLPMKRQGDSYSANYTAAELIKWVGICAGLGETSRNTWLKIPYTRGFERVSLATTLPMLLLGGPAHGDPLPTLSEFAAGMRSGNNVRGTMVGRNVMFPGDEDPLSMTAAVTAVVRQGLDPEAALPLMEGLRDTRMDALTRYL